MAFLFGNWGTDHRLTRIAGQLDDRRLISSMFDISLPTGCLVTAVARRQVGVDVNRLVGVGLLRIDTSGGGMNFGALFH